MADLTLTAAQFRPMEGIELRTLNGIADEAITAGQVLYRKTNGKFGVARGNAVGTSKVAGIASSSAAAGAGVEAIYHGRVVGWDLSSINGGVTVYLSITAGGLIADAAAVGTGNVVVPLGQVHAMSDRDVTKYLFIDIPLNAVTPTAL